MPATEATYRFIEHEAPRFTERVRAAAQLWVLTNEEPAEIKRSLKELRGQPWPFGCEEAFRLLPYGS